jgi:hypothetical protein
VLILIAYVTTAGSLGTYVEASPISRGMSISGCCLVISL